MVSPHARLLGQHPVANQTAQIDWRDGESPISTRFDDPYYSRTDGLAETRHVYLRGNDLPARFACGFHIAELGFGTGLNMLAVWELWTKSAIKGPLHFTSFEKYPVTTADMARALRAFPQLAGLAAQFLARWPGTDGHLTLLGLNLRVIIGDANQTLAIWPGVADAWFLDGFSPAKNPGLWTAPLMQKVAAHTRIGGTFATYTAAGHVRRALSDAGFTVTRSPGYGCKRHMTAGQLTRPK